MTPEAQCHGISWRFDHATGRFSRSFNFVPRTWHPASSATVLGYVLSYPWLADRLLGLVLRRMEAP